MTALRDIVTVCTLCLSRTSWYKEDLQYTSCCNIVSNLLGFTSWVKIDFSGQRMKRALAADHGEYTSLKS